MIQFHRYRSDIFFCTCSSSITAALRPNLVSEALIVHSQGWTTSPKAKVQNGALAQCSGGIQGRGK
jgi:hypothetical protein